MNRAEAWLDSDESELDWSDNAAIAQLQRERDQFEDENLKLRHCLSEIEELIRLAPRREIPRSVRLKRHLRYTLMTIFTRSLPRMAVIWGGAALVAYIVTKFT